MSAEHDHRVGSVIAAALAVLLLGAAIASAQDQVEDFMPNPALTPGVANPAVTQSNIHSTICVPGWTKTIRPPASYTSALKRQQLADPVRGYRDQDPRHYELDHLISLELGGHPTDERNLWPELWDGPWGAHVKDRVENRLKVEVCAGRISLADAQMAIRMDFRKPYCRYVGGPPCP